MGSSSKYGGRVVVKPRPWQIHPIWRGIGCLMLILIPLLSLAGAQLLIDNGVLASVLGSFGFPIPADWMQELFAIPAGDVTYSVTITTLILAGLLMFVSFALLMVFYTIMYSAMGPARYGPLDAPPERYVRKKSYVKRS